MFKSHTVFVVGAGASCEASLPSGAQLARIIGKKLNIRLPRHGIGAPSGDAYIIEVVQYLSQRYPSGQGGYAEYFNACGDISYGLPLSNSIDEYMDSRKENELIQICGKLAIAATVLEAENASKLYVDPLDRSGLSVFSNGNLSDTWFVKFFKLLSSGLDKEHVGSIFQNVSFIVFNYDRCIEHFLIEALRLKYDLSGDSARQIVGTLQIFHPYGVVGHLPTRGPLNETVPFGSRGQHPESLLKIAQHLRTYTQEIEETDELQKIRVNLSNAHTIVFLGFAFHPQNMSLLQLSSPTSANRIFGTALGFSLPDRNAIINQIHATIMPQLQQLALDPSPCAVFFDDYQRTLALG